MQYIFVSGWRREPGKGGISQYMIDPESGKIKLIRTVFEDISFNVMLIDQQKNILYALNEVADQPGFKFGGGGSIYALWLSPDTGEILKTERYPAMCSNPCNIALSLDEKMMIVTGHGTRNYVTRLVHGDAGWHTAVFTDSTPVILFSVNEDGEIGDVLDAKQHDGDGPTPKQMISHPHSATRSPSGNLFGICDKGNDNFYIYKIDSERKKLVCCDKSRVHPGTEPRYCVFHPNKKFVYHNNENTSNIFAYIYEESGMLEWTGSYEALTPGTDLNGSKKAEQQGLCISSDGKYLYDVINGPNVIAVFEINQKDGTLKLVQNVKVDYTWPRGAAISDDGKFLGVGCVSGKKFIVYKINNNGTLEYADAVDQDNAAYVTFWNTGD